MEEPQQHHPKTTTTTTKIGADNHKNSGQTRLDGSTIRGKYKPKYSKQQCQFLETFYLNPNLGISPTMLRTKDVHYNTVINFITRAVEEGLITQMNFGQSGFSQNFFGPVRKIYRLETGQLAKNKRHKYYRLTDKGMKTYEKLRGL